MHGQQCRNRTGRDILATEGVLRRPRVEQVCELFMTWRVLLHRRLGRKAHLDLEVPPTQQEPHAIAVEEQRVRRERFDVSRTMWLAPAHAFMQRGR